MEEQKTQVQSDGTQITTRSEVVRPDPEKDCHASIQIQVVVSEPLTNNTWRLVCSEKDSYNVVLSERDTNKIGDTIRLQLRELQELWKKNNKEIISLHNPLNIEPTEKQTK